MVSGSLCKSIFSILNENIYFHKRFIKYIYIYIYMFIKESDNPPPQNSVYKLCMVLKTEPKWSIRPIQP